MRILLFVQVAPPPPSSWYNTPSYQTLDHILVNQLSVTSPRPGCMLSEVCWTLNTSNIFQLTSVFMRWRPGEVDDRLCWKSAGAVYNILSFDTLSVLLRNLCWQFIINPFIATFSFLNYTNIIYFTWKTRQFLAYFSTWDMILVDNMQARIRRKAEMRKLKHLKGDACCVCYFESCPRLSVFSVLR